MKQEKSRAKRWDKFKAETSNLILESARYLFATKGFTKTTIREIATHAEIGLGTIYKHYKNKNSLLAAAMYDDLTSLFHEAKSSIPQDVLILDQLIHFAGFYYRYYTSKPELSREYLTHIVFVEGEWEKKFELFEKDYAMQINELIDAAKERGEVSNDKDSHLMTMSFIANYFLVLMEFFIRRKSKDPDKMLEYLKKLIALSVC